MIASSSLGRSAILTPLLAVMAVSLVASSSEATNFALLLGSGDSQDRSIKNPTYEETGAGGENPLYEPSVMIFSPPQLTGGRNVLLTINLDDSITGATPPVPGGGFLFELLLEDADTGASITQFANPIEIGFVVPRLDGLGDRAGDDLALSFFDEASGEWVVEDKGLARCDHGGLCGKTDHFTVFAIGPAPIPEPTAGLMLGVLGLFSACCRRRA